MPFLYVCPSCGHELKFISNKRLKCYGCGKYYADSYGDEAICKCERISALKFSIEIIAANEGICVLCGREKQVAGNLEPPYIEKYEGGRGAGGLGSWDGQISSFQPPVKKPRAAKKPKQKVREIEKPEVDYVSEDRGQIVIKFPGHDSLDQIRCEIVNGTLEVQSLLVDFLEKFPLPDFPVGLKSDFKNAVLSIHLKRKVKK